MERILSKEEIAELLSAVHSGEIEADPTEHLHTPDEKVKSLDLIRCSASSGQWRHANLEIILDTFAKNYGISMTNRLQRSLSIQRDEIESSTFDPFMLNLNDKGTIGIMRLEPLSHAALIVFDSKLSYALIEIMLGGSPGLTPLALNRPLTAIEINIASTLIENACADIEKCFMPLEKLKVTLVKTLTDPRMVNIVPPETEMMIIKFTVSIDDLTGAMNLAIPYTSLEPLKEKLKQGFTDIQESRKDPWKYALINHVNSVDIKVAAQLGELSLSIRDILDLQEGDIIDLDFQTDIPLKILVEDQPKYLALPALQNGNKAVRVAGRIQPGDYDGNP